MFFFLDTALAPQRVKLILLWMCSWCLAPPTSCSWTNSSPILGGLNAHPLYTKLSPNHQEVRWRQQSLQQGNGQWEYDQALRQGKWDHPPQKKHRKKLWRKVPLPVSTKNTQLIQVGGSMIYDSADVFLLGIDLTLGVVLAKTTISTLPPGNEQRKSTS